MFLQSYDLFGKVAKNLVFFPYIFLYKIYPSVWNVENFIYICTVI